MDAVAGCAIFEMFQPEDRAKVVGLLEGAIQKNPYCDSPWRLMGRGVADGTIPQKQGERIYDGMLKSFAAYPDLTFQVLKEILAPRLKPAEKPAEAEIARNLQVLEKAFQVYEAAKRPDLSVRLRCLQGQYLEAVGRREEALKLYVMASEKYASEHYGFVSLYDRAVKMMQEDRQQDMLLKYMGMVAGKVPRFQGDFNQKHDLVNPVYVRVVKAYSSALRAAGKAADADGWDAKIPTKKPT
jgi:tetratricopeptide (TPR) repeat protein